MKTFRIICIIIIAFLLGHFIGANDIYMAADVHKDGTESIWYPHYASKATLQSEKEFSAALTDGLEWFRYHADEWDEFAKTEQYAKIDSFFGGDWGF